MPKKKQSKWPSTQISLLGRIREPANQAAWDTFVQLYMPLIYRYCRRRRLQDADAQDVTQTVLANVSRAIRDFEYDPQKGRFRNWLGTIAFREIRRLQTQAKRNIQAGGKPSGDGKIGKMDARAEADWHDEFNASVYRLAKLRVQPRFEATTWGAFELTWEQDEPPADVADKMGKTIAWVYKAKFKVLKRLTEEVEYLATDAAVLQQYRP